MRKSEYIEDDASDYIFSDEDLDFEDDDYESSDGKLSVKRGIEDYFDRKELESLDDWFDEL